MTKSSRIALLGGFFCFIIFVCSNSDAYSQTVTDSVKAVTNANTQTEKNPEDELFAPMTKSPSGAIWRSLAAPGWGQVYVESYWKAPLFFGGAVTLYYFIFKNNSDIDKYDKQMQKYPDKTSYDYLWAKSNREYSRDNRDLSAFYLLGVYAISSIDAYVGAHLFDFNVDDKLTYAVLPDKYGGISVQLSYKY